MGPHIVAMAHQTALAFDQPAAGGTDLEQDTERSVDLGIGRTLANVEIVEAFLGGVEARLAVEEGDVVLRDPSGQLPGLFGDERVAAQGFPRVEIEGAFRTHFVEIGGHHGLPAVPLGQPGLALGLGLQQPLPVEIEPVVIGPRRGPQIVLFVVGIGDRHRAAIGLDMVHPPGMTVGIEDRGDQDDRLAQVGLDFRAFRRGIVVEGGNRCIHARGLGTVHAVVQPDDGGRVGIRLGAGLQAGEMVLADLVNPGMVFRRGHDEEEDRAALVGITDRLDRDAIGNLGQFREIGHHLVVPDRPVADAESETVFGRRDALVIGRGVQLVEFDRFGVRRGGGERGKRAGEGDQSCHAVPLVLRLRPGG